jgi:hypothetical protein
MAKNKSAVSVAKNNVKQGFSSPAAKVGIGVLFVGLCLAGTAAYRLLDTKDVKPGVAQADGYNVQAGDPRGGVGDGATVEAVENANNKNAKASLEQGGSFAGPFTFQTAQAPRLNIKDGFDESGKTDGGKMQYTEEQVLAELRSRAADLDRTDEMAAKTGQQQTNAARGANGGTSGQGGTYAGSQQGNYSNTPGYSQVDAKGNPMPYGVTEKDFNDIVAQLNKLGGERGGYSSLANGRLKMEEKAAQTPAAAQGPTGTHQVAAGASSQGGGAVVGQAAVKKRTAVEAGTICAATTESAIDTDFPTPVFVELQDCKELTGSRFRGTIQRGPADFVVVFNELFLSSKHKFKLVGKAEAISANLDKDGKSGIAQNVDNHWLSRLGSAGILSLAKTEKQFLAARGTTQVTTGVSSSTTVQPLSDKEKNDMRIAGLLEGGMDVITRDTQYGVNRQATMSRDRGTVIGVQFISNVEVTDE